MQNRPPINAYGKGGEMEKIKEWIKGIGVFFGLLIFFGFVILATMAELGFRW